MCFFFSFYPYQDCSLRTQTYFRCLSFSRRMKREREKNPKAGVAHHETLVTQHFRGKCDIWNPTCSLVAMKERIIFLREPFSFKKKYCSIVLTYKMQ